MRCAQQGHLPRPRRAARWYVRGTGRGVSRRDTEDLHLAPDLEQLEFASWKERKLLAAALEPTYSAKATKQVLCDFEHDP